MFGQDAVPLKAGDPAPEIDWSKVVCSPEAAKYQPNLAGQYTVLYGFTIAAECHGECAGDRPMERSDRAVSR